MNYEELILFLEILGLLGLTFIGLTAIMGVIIWLADRRRMK